MLILAVVVGAITAYYWGLRAGAYAAIGSLGLSLLALVVPSLATPLHVATAAGMVAVWWFGSRRPRPPDSVLAIRFLRGAATRAWSKVTSARRDEKSRD
jgi:hypothetical protein